MSRTRYLLAAAGALGLAACSQTTDGTTDAAATDAAATDATATDTAMASDAAMTPATGESQATTFLTDAMMIDNAEIAAGQMAVDKGSSQGVKDFGRMLVSEHTAHKAKLVALAGPMNVPATDDTKPDAKALAARLEGLSGAAFDKAFAEGMEDGHKKAIAMYEAQGNAGGPEPVTALVKETLPVLRKHLATAEGLQEDM